MPAARRMLIAGNWKMNPPSAAESFALADAIRGAVPILEGVDVVVCPPFTYLDLVRGVLRGSAIAVGAQTMHWEDHGAYTGEISPAMLAAEPGDPLATHVILGHSERRQYDGETDERVGRKVASAVAHGLRPIAAVGERADERREGATASVVDRQLRAALGGLDRLAGTGLVVAYEPVWAIGTGDAASGVDAQEVAAQIRAILREVDPDGADEVPIQYGGSVTGDNAAEFFDQPDIDGALVGGASLRPDQFAGIVRAAGASLG
jgi:triosephosphate isomerase (TIM)